MRSALLLFAPLLSACNGLTGVEKYVLDGDEGGATAQEAGSSEGDGGGGASEAGASCPPTTSAVIAKCSSAQLAAQDETDPGAPRLIRAPSGDQQSPYVPNCVTIRAGQTVTWTGNLTSHPVIPREDSTLPNPINTSGPGVTQWPVTFPCPGDFNFSCRNHRDEMLGTIRVLP